MAQRTTKNTPSSHPESDIRAAQEQANANAQKQASDAGYVAGIQPPPEQPSHASKERPADAGWVGGSAAELAARSGPYKGGEQVFTVTPEGKQKVNDPASKNPEPEKVSNEGVPDLPAIEKHNQHFAEIAEATANSHAAAGKEAEGMILGTPEEGADKSNVIEGNLPGPVSDAADGDEK